MNTEFHIILQKLDEFVRKYYKNRFLHGAIHFALVVLLAFLFVVVLEYFGHFGKGVRALLFYGFVSTAVFFLTKYVIVPLAAMYKLGRVMDYKQASVLVGKYIPEIDDKLLNAIQLNEISTQQASALLQAAIAQKVQQLQPVKFSDAIQLKQNIRYAKYLSIPLLVYLLVYVFAPDVIENGSTRLVNYNATFVQPAPFRFVLNNNSLEVPQYSDVELNLELVGKAIPNEVYAVVNGLNYKMQKVDATHYNYTIRNVNKDVALYFEAAGFTSGDYTIKAIAKPVLVNYQLKLQYPAYTGKQQEVLQNPGDINIPAGTTVSWYFTTAKTDEVILGFQQKEVQAEKKSNGNFFLNKRFLASTGYYIKNKNNTFGVADSLYYQISVTPDAYPMLSIEEKADSITGKQLYFIGDADDDYGLTKLVFAYRYLKSENQDKLKQGAVLKPVAIGRNEKSQRFYYQINLNETGLTAGEELEYYFEVWDNDGVQGPKSAKSKVMMYKAPSEKEIRQEMSSAGNALKAEMQEAINESKKLQKDLKELQLKMLEKRELTWEEKKKAEELLKRQKELVQKIEDIKKQEQLNRSREEEFKPLNEELMQKQQQLEKLFNEVMNDELKKLLKDMERMLQQQNKDLIKEQMDKMQLNNKDVEKELDRMLEQYKQLELDKKINDATNKLEQLAEKQKQLAEETKQLDNNKSLNKEQKEQKLDELKQKQEQLNTEFKDAQQQLKEIEQNNKQLETPRELADTKQEEQKAKQEQQNASENLNKKDSKKAAQNQQEAAENMQEMANKMKEQQEKEEEEQAEEDAAALREILENLIQLSKDQEELIQETKQVNGYNPQYVELAKKQKITRDNAKLIEDSLLALSKRVPQIRAFINREVTKMNDNLDKSIQGFSTRNMPEIRVRQQYAMMHANNLAVMLSEALNQMQQEQQQQKSKQGKGKPKPKPGKGGKGSKPLTMSQIKKMQEELNKQLREGMNKQGENGKPKDEQGKQPGGKPQGGQNGMSSESFARMAAQQMAIRQQLQKMMQQMDAKQKEGLGGNKMLEEMKQMMEQTEKELFNKKLTNEMLMRQQDILTRLLESEKAERKQEQEEKREAEQANEKPKPAPPAFEQFIQTKKREQELLETIPADMQPYYKEKAKSYFNKLNQ